MARRLSRSRLRPVAGTSLIEVLVATLIMAVGLAGIFTALGSGHRDAGRIEDEIQATNLSQNVLDFLATLAKRQLPIKTNTGTPFVDLPLSALPEAMAAVADTEVVSACRRKIADLRIPREYEIRVTIQRLGSSSTAVGESRESTGDMLQVVVTTRWISAITGGNQVARQIVLTTLIGDDRRLDL